MKNLACRADLPILMLYDVDLTWAKDKIYEFGFGRKKNGVFLRPIWQPVGEPGGRTPSASVINEQYTFRE